MILKSDNAILSPSKTAFNRVPEVLWCQIFKYCELRDFVVLRLVSVRLKSRADNYTDIFERECLRLFTTDLPLFRYVVSDPSFAPPLGSLVLICNSIEIPQCCEDAKCASSLEKAAAPADSPNWKILVQKFGWTLRDWPLVSSIYPTPILQAPTLRLLRDFVLSVLKGTLNPD